MILVTGEVNLLDAFHGNRVQESVRIEFVVHAADVDVVHVQQDAGSRSASATARRKSHSVSRESRNVT